MTISIVLPVIKSIMKVMVAKEDDPNYICEMKAVMLTDFKERVSDLLDLGFLMKSAALDPRFKNMKVVDSKVRREAVFRELEDEIGDYVRDQQEKLTETDVLMKDPKRKRNLCLDFDVSDDEDINTNDNEVVKREIESYKSEPLLEQDSDPLDWWKGRKDKYPNLVRLVR